MKITRILPKEEKEKSTASIWKELECYSLNEWIDFRVRVSGQE